MTWFLIPSPSFQTTKFDANAVSDLLHLKQQAQLTDDQIGEILREVALRTFKKYGILMTDTTGLTADAIMKKGKQASRHPPTHTHPHPQSTRTHLWRMHGLDY